MNWQKKTALQNQHYLSVIVIHYIIFAYKIKVYIYVPSVTLCKEKWFVKTIWMEWNGNEALNFYFAEMENGNVFKICI